MTRPKSHRSAAANSSAGGFSAAKIRALFSRLIYAVTSGFFDADYFSAFSYVFLLVELFASVFVINASGYTEIDWIAYMQQVRTFVINGSLDYTTLKGDTGPLVYPAGHLYLYTLFYYLTDSGSNVRLAQYVFVLIYIILLFFVFRIYARSKVVPPYCLIFVCLTSYRIHSICLLRLFNDPIAMLLLYAAILACLCDRWTLCCILYSLAVSVKMNILLFAPALFVLLLTRCGFIRAICNLFACGFIQALLGAPFLLANPWAYISRSFNFGRIFEYKWTVNWRFVPEQIFVDKIFHISLLLLHVTILLAFAFTRWMRKQGGLYHALKSMKIFDLEARDIIYTFFTANFIGVAFSRSLHYQFYVWYFHTLPFLLWSIDNWSPVVRLVILGVIEFCWNTYPSTTYSSIALHVCHALMLIGLWKNDGKRRLVVKKE